MGERQCQPTCNWHFRGQPSMAMSMLWNKKGNTSFCVALYFSAFDVTSADIDFPTMTLCIAQVKSYKDGCPMSAEKNFNSSRSLIAGVYQGWFSTSSSFSANIMRVMNVKPHATDHKGIFTIGWEPILMFSWKHILLTLPTLDRDSKFREIPLPISLPEDNMAD